MTAPVEEPRTIPDGGPPTEEDAITCLYPGCGVELAYAGTGRKPSKCDEHRRLREPKAKAAPAPQVKGGNERLAGQAVDVLCQVNGMAAMMLMFGRLMGTASELSERNDAFREQAYQALLTDPGLCRTIINGGAKSGKLMLFAAYGALVMGIWPTAVEEIRELRESRAERAEQEAAA